jgi:hypothetical protein
MLKQLIYERKPADWRKCNNLKNATHFRVLSYSAFSLLGFQFSTKYYSPILYKSLLLL